MLSRPLLRWIYCLCLCISLMALGGCYPPGIQTRASNPQTADTTVTPPAFPRQITVQELAQRIQAGDDSYWLIDVRTAEEVAIATIPTSTPIPIAEIEDGSAIERIQADQGNRQIILHCYSGVRSRRAQKQLEQVDIATTDLKGGIKAWRKQIDPSLPQRLLP